MKDVAVLYQEDVKMLLSHQVLELRKRCQALRSLNEKEDREKSQMKICLFSIFEWGNYDEIRA